MDDLRSFFHTVSAAPNPGATAAELDAFEARMGLSLLPQLRAFYASTNGLTTDDVWPANRMKILPLAEVMPYVEGMRQYGIPQVWGYFPFTDCNDSNPLLCVLQRAAAESRRPCFSRRRRRPEVLGLGSIPGRCGGRAREQGGRPPPWTDFR
jgi:SMI1/KNR4 family protein SUKH-1